MAIRNSLAEALIEAAQGKDISPPASLKAIHNAEQAFGIELPSDMLAFYEAMNGMQWPTLPERGWIRIWSVESLRRVRDEAALRSDLSKYADLWEAIIIADHCDESWYYAAAFGHSADLPVFLVDGLRPAKLVAMSFTGFVRAALADASGIYPDPETAG